MTDHLDVTDSVHRQAALDAARYVKCLVASGDAIGAAARFERDFPFSPNLASIRRRAQLLTRGAVDGMNASNSAALVPADLATPLVDLAIPFSILPRLGAVRVPGRRPVAALVGQPTCYWGAQGTKPLSAGAFVQASVDVDWLAVIVVVSNELLRGTSAASDLFLRDTLARALAAGTDVEFLKSARAASDSPALTSSGVLATDLADVLGAYRDQGGSMSRATIIMSSANAASASLRWPEVTRDLGRQGGTLAALPALCSDSAGNVLAVVDSGRVLLADEGELAIAVGRHASLEMSDDPANESGAVVSMFQTNQIALRCEQLLGWQLLAGSVASIGDCDYLASSSPA